MKKGDTYISRQAKRLSRGQIDRRRFVMSALASGVTMPTAMSLASRAEAAGPKSGGHLRFGVSGPESLARHVDRACVASPAYRVARQTSDGTITLERTPDHPNGSGHFDAVELRPMPDARLRQNAIMTGEVDVIEAVDPRTLAMLSGLPDVTIAESEGLAHLALEPAFADENLFAALKHSIDRKVLLERAYLGHGAIGDDTPARTATPLALQDARLARRYLLAAGHRDLTLGIAVSDDCAGHDLVPLLNAATAPIGLTLQEVRHGEQAALRLLRGHGPAPSDRRLIPVWTNDLVAHGSRLARPEGSGSDDVLLRWWFA